MKKNKFKTFKVILITLNVFSAILFLNGQTYNKRYIFNEVQATLFSSIYLKGDTSLIVYGRNAINQAPNYPAKPTLFNFNFSGLPSSFLTERGDSLLEYILAPNALFKKDKKVLLVGASGTGFFSNNYGMACLINQDSSFDWIKSYSTIDDSNSFAFYSGVIMDDETLFLSGTKRSNGILHGVLLHADQFGNELWRKKYSEINHNYSLSSSLLEPDGNISLGFGIRNNNEEHWHTMLMRIDTAGNEIDRWVNDTEGTYEPRRILRTADGGYLFVGNVFKEYSSSSGILLTQGYICKLDAAWNKEWERKLGFRGKTTFHNVIELEDGDFVAVGNVLDTFQTLNGYYQKGWMVKFDIEGNILWEQNPYRPETVESYLFDVVELPDGSLVACGVSNNLQADSFPQRGWLLRVNADGCMDWGCFTDLEEYVSPEESPYQIAPNPVTDYFRVSVPPDMIDWVGERSIGSLLVYDGVGRAVLHEHYSKGTTTVEVDASDWASGIYYVVVNGRWVEKVLIQ